MVQTLERTRPGTVQIVPSRSPAGETQFSVLVKRSYRIEPGKAAQRHDRDAALRLTDAYYDGGDPSWSVLEHENEMAPFKAATDVVIVGTAYAPEGKPVSLMVAGVRVGEHRKLLQMTGDRVCHWRQGAAPVYSDPLPFTQMPIRYDRAYGGLDEKSDAKLPFYYPRNDMGRGVALRNVKDAVQGLALPNIEDPQDLLSPERVVIGDPLRWPLQPLPQGFGWRQRTWYPRSALLGAVPAFLQPGTTTAEEQMQLLPANHVALARQMRLPLFERQFHNGASIGLVLPAVRADEQISLCGLTPQGVFDFSLPGETPEIALDVGQGEQALNTALLTVSIRPDEQALDMIWSGLLNFGPASKLSKLTRLRATVQ